jgi:replicative DNA helicase
MAMGIAEHVAVSLGQPVGVFSLEMTSEALVPAPGLLAGPRERAVDPGRLPRRSRHAEAHHGRHEAGQGPGLHIDDTPGLSILQLRARARRMWQQHGVKLVVIDYLQLPALDLPESPGSASRRSRTSPGRREGAGQGAGYPGDRAEPAQPRESRRTRAAKLRSDLRESGAIEQDADLVGLLYKPAPEDDAEAGQACTVEPVNLLIAKQRNGPTGDVKADLPEGHHAL